MKLDTSIGVHSRLKKYSPDTKPILPPSRRLARFFTFRD